MCVAVSLMPGATLTKEEVWRMGTQNGDGFGFAWVKDGAVHWYKTLNYKVEHVTNALDIHLASPRLVHFRYATVGGTRADLCHPFAIDGKGTCDAVGSAPKVMIHNGHFNRWRELHELMEKEGLLPDKGPWSDTRLVALLAADDLDWLNIIGGRVATLDGGGQLTHLGDWDDLREGVRVSNKNWNHEVVVKQGGYTGFKSWKGWDQSWKGEKSWEEHERMQREKEEQRKADIRAILADKAEANGQKEVQGKEDEAVKGQGAKGHHDRGLQPVRPSVGVGQGSGGGSAGGGHRGVGVQGQAPGRVYDGRPWTNPGTGRVFQARPDGTVVEITAHADAAPTSRRGAGGDPGDESDHEQYWRTWLEQDRKLGINADQERGGVLALRRGSELVARGSAEAIAEDLEVDFQGAWAEEYGGEG